MSETHFIHQSNDAGSLTFSFLPPTLSELPTANGGPCITLYQPTHRRHPENQQDLIRFKKLVKEIESVFEGTGSGHEEILEPFYRLMEDRAFWNRTYDGLAIFSAKGILEVYRLQRSVPELATVADHFHITPMVRIYQTADRYQILGISRDKIRFFEGNRDVVDEVDLVFDVPRTIEAALGTELTEPYLKASSYGGIRSDGAAMHHGHGSKADEIDVDLEKFFRTVDRAILAHYSNPSGLPLILAGLPENQAHFRKYSHNLRLLPEGVDAYPDTLSAEELKKRAWKVVSPLHQARLSEVSEQYGNAKSHQKGSEKLSEVAKAAIAGKVDTLLIEANRQVPGSIDLATGKIRKKTKQGTSSDDVLNELGELVLKKGGRIFVVPANRIPSKTGAAAIYRY